jgi:hypothetical protein
MLNYIFKNKDEIMKRYSIIIIFTLLLCVSAELPASTATINQQLEQVQPGKGSFSSFPASLYEAVKAVESLPDAAKLIDEVQAEGPIGIESQYFTESDFEALWDSENRIIYVNASRNDTLGKEISSILFELHNAKTNKNLRDLFQQAKSGQIDKDSYVKCVERMEHGNALNTSLLIEKGIDQSIFPEDSRWEIFSSFEDHYKIQQIYGHSQWIAERFDSMCPTPRRKTYNGTIDGIDKMSLGEKDKIVRLLVLKNQMNSGDAREAQQALQEINKELKKVELCEATHATNCAEHSIDKKLLKLVFKNP